MKNKQKSSFLDPTISKITPAKEKERRKRKSEEEEGRRRERKRSVATWEMGEVLAKKKLFDGRGIFGGNVFKNSARDIKEFKHELVIKRNK